MADYDRRMVTTATVEYGLKTPTNAVEISKVLAGLRQEIPDEQLFDDTVTVTTRDEEIVFSYVASVETTA